MFSFFLSGLSDTQTWSATWRGCKRCSQIGWWKLTSEPLFCSVMAKPLKRRRGYWKLRKARQTIWGRLEKREKYWWICKRIKKNNKFGNFKWNFSLNKYIFCCARFVSNGIWCIPKKTPALLILKISKSWMTRSLTLNRFSVTKPPDYHQQTVEPIVRTLSHSARLAIASTRACFDWWTIFSPKRSGLCVVKALFTHQCRSGTVNFLPDQDSKVRPWQEAPQYVTNFIMQSTTCQERVVQRRVEEDSQYHPVLCKCNEMA